jgi:hypothetical protein
MKNTSCPFQKPLIALSAVLLLQSSFAADKAPAIERSSVSGKVVDVSAKSTANQPEDARKALAAFDDLLRAFESGNPDSVRQKFDHSVIGYQKIMDGVSQEQNECKQIRVNLLNTQVQADASLAVVETSWEKRCLLLPNLTPKLTTGRSTATFRSGPDGWIFSGITGDSMLERSSRPAQRVVTKVAATGPSTHPTGTPPPATTPAPTSLAR